MLLASFALAKSWETASDRKKRFVLHFNDFSGSHAAEPFANVSFVEARVSGELRARAGTSAAKALKEAGAMSDGNHQAQRAMVEDFEIAGAEFVEAFGVNVGFAS